MNTTTLRILSLAALAGAPSIAVAQTSQIPGRMSYQGIVTDTANNLVGAGTPVNREVFFRIYDAASGGNVLYSEKQIATVAEGEFSVLVGAGAAITGQEATGPGTVNLANVFNGSTRYLGVTVDGAAGDGAQNDSEISPRQQIVTTGFAFRAKEAETVINNSIGTSAIADTSITLAKMATASVNSSAIVDASIATGDLANSAVTLGKLASNSVDSGKIVDASIATADLANTSVTLAKLAADAVDSSKILDGTIATADLANTSVTLAKLATGAVDSSKILDGTIATADLAAGTVTAAKLGSDVGLWTVSGANVLRTTGNVGVGTASPGHLLDVNGNIRTLGNLYVANSSGTSPTADPFRIDGFFDDLQIVNEITNVATGGGIQLSSRGQMVMRVFDGKIGINNSSPSYALDVHSNATYDVMRLEVSNGNEWVFAVHPSNADLEMKNNAGAVVGKFVSGSGQYVQLSDRRAKTRIKPLEPLLDKVMRLEPSSYWLKEDADAPLRSLGFISQDVEKLFPELISESAGGVKMLDYTGLVPVAVRAVQELKARHDEDIAALKLQITAREKRIAELEAKDKARDERLAAIETILGSLPKPPAQTVSNRPAD